MAFLIILFPFLPFYILPIRSGFNCTWDAAEGYQKCYDGDTIVDPYHTYPEDLLNRPKGGSNNIGYVMTISTCPEDVNAVGDPLVDNKIYYDAYAVARHSICGITTQSEELINGLPRRWISRLANLCHPASLASKKLRVAVASLASPLVPSRPGRRTSRRTALPMPRLSTRSKFV